jgi:hypothetical protein
MTQIETFSDEYYIIDAEILEYGGSTVGAPADLIQAIGEFAPAPILKLGNKHYWAEPEPRVPADTVVVPKHEDVRTDVPVLVAKDQVGTGGVL